MRRNRLSEARPGAICQVALNRQNRARLQSNIGLFLSSLLIVANAGRHFFTQ